MNNLMDEMLDGASAQTIENTMNQIDTAMDNSMESLTQDLEFGYGSAQPSSTGYGEVIQDMEKAGNDLAAGHVNQTANMMEQTADAEMANMSEEPANRTLQIPIVPSSSPTLISPSPSPSHA